VRVDVASLVGPLHPPLAIYIAVILTLTTS